MRSKVWFWRCAQAVCAGVIYGGLVAGWLAGVPAVVAADGLELKSPQDYQVVQRHRREDGAVVVAGRWRGGLKAGDVVEARVVSGPWQEVVQLAADQAEFEGKLTLPAGGWYRVEVRVLRQESVLAQAEVEHVGVGEVFVIAGQSNSANHGEERQTVRSGLVATMIGSGWRLAEDPQPGASGGGGSFMPPFGDAMAARFKVPIGLVAAGAGGTSVREWLPRGSRFPSPPTVLSHVTQLNQGEWESRGRLFDMLMARMALLGPGGFRALLWHQGESDANQRDATRTLSGDLYRRYMEQLIRASWREAGWEFPWFVAQATYHAPDDPGSPEIRSAQAALWAAGLALEGPDTDMLRGEMRDQQGQGVHFSGAGLRAHAALWVEKVAPWVDQQCAEPRPPPERPLSRSKGPTPRLNLPGMETFEVAGRPAFVILPPEEKRGRPQPWVFYAPTLPAYPDGAEQWMHEQFLASGVAVAGVDVGEAYGSPQSHVSFEALRRELMEKRDFAAKPCLLGRSRGGLWVSSWALAHPERVAGVAGIYPVFDWRTYPGLERAAPAYGLSPEQLTERQAELNPVARLGKLAQAGVPVFLIHGDADTVVPMMENSGELMRHYRDSGAEALVRLIVLEGLGHSYDERFFRSGELVDFVIEKARAGAKP